MSVGIDLTDHVALVTGAAGGIGRQIGRTLLAAGAKVAFADIADRELAAEDSNGIAVRLDVTDPASARDALERVTGQLGPVDVLVNNAGIAAKRQGMPFTNQEATDWEPVLRVNAIGTFVVSRAFVLSRPTDRPGVIVNIASISGQIGSSTDPGYSASKAAVISLTKTMARDLAPHVRVCGVNPGMLMTPFYEAQYRAAAERDPTVAALTPEQYFDQKAQALIPMGRGQRPDEIGAVVAFLASDLASSITGQILNVDGGLVI